jgi:ABC-type lipoprotein export system ATPase subunit
MTIAEKPTTGTTATKYPRGSEWRKWDLHVHTPASIVHEYSGSDPWMAFLADLETLPPEFKVLGINDYIFLDGYRRLLEEKNKNSRLKNIDLLLPVIELRLDKFGGSPNELRRVNYHVIFSNELDPDVIEQHFLHALTHSYQVSPQYEQAAKKWTALPTRKAIEDLGTLIIGSVPTDKQKEFGPPLVEGFNNLCFSLEKIDEALKSHYFDKNFITAVGKTEWADIKWTDQSIAEKKNIINTADLVFISSESPDDWARAKEGLSQGGVNDRLLDCSDAHRYSTAQDKDRIGNCFTWIKADPTFEGLLQVLTEPEERVFVGDMPPQLIRVRNNATKYIESLTIEKKSSAALSEIWFNNNIPLNPGLVAIIGNKGKGKSALTDIIGLLGNTRQHGDFTFLSPDNFRQSKDNKAKYFQATLTWASGSPIKKGLEELVDERQPELVKYIPQNFLEKICTQLGKIEESDFDRELKKVIFSHVRDADRLGKATLDELVAYKTSEASNRIKLLQQELRRINETLIELEERGQPEHREKIENLLTLKKKELDSVEKSKPADVAKPELDPARQKEISAVSAEIETAKKRLLETENQVLKATEEQIAIAQRISVVAKLTGRLDNLQRQIQNFLAESEKDLSSVGLSADAILKFEISKQPLLDKNTSFTGQKKALDEQLDPLNKEGLIQKAQQLEAEIEKLQSKLDEPHKKYEAYQAALRSWEKQRDIVIGSETAAGTIKFYEARLAELDAVPHQLSDIKENRLAKAREIHAVIRQLADTYRELYEPVHQFIERRPLARQKFQLNFEVGIIDTGFRDGFFDIVTQGVAGTFCGVEQGHKMLTEILAKHDFNTETGTEAFLEEMMTSLEQDKRPGGKPVRVGEQLRKGKGVLALYDWIFSLEYLKPRYELRMGTKELSQLSPGERGTLLLVFYLLVDKGDIPLIIDQPEENLDNQTVYELLVPCMKEARQRRQVFIVTHNPNLAVVCDAEQVVCASLDKVNNYRMEYLSGSIENPTINKAIVDILEGTRPAFKNRESKYEVSA